MSGGPTPTKHSPTKLWLGEANDVSAFAGRGRSVWFPFSQLSFRVTNNMEPEIEDKTLELMCSVPRSLWLGCSSVAESLCALRCLQSIPSTRAHNQNTSVMESQNHVDDLSPKKTTVLTKLSNGPVMTGSRKRPSEGNYDKEKEHCIALFDQWSEADQVEFVEHLISRMCHYQHGHINSYLKPMLQRDFITALPAQGLDHIAENILSFLDAQSLCSAELVCKEWQRVISEGMLWKKLIERMVRTDPLWKGLSERHQWEKYLFKNRTTETIEANWRCGRHNLQRIQCRSENSKGVYCLQYDDDKIISGLRDNSIKIWDKQSLECLKILTGHTGSVLCLQYDERVIVTGSSDSTVRVWDVTSGEVLNTLIHHNEAVLHLRFCNGLMVTCSKDRSIAVWDMASPTDISLRRVLVGHRAAVNVVDFDDKYIVSASGDRTIKVWSTSTCEFVRTLNGHKRGIACLHKIKVWDLQAALDPRAPASTLCLRTLVEHSGRVFRLQFDEFQIISSSHDDTILIWDFLNVSTNGQWRHPLQRFLEELRSDWLMECVLQRGAQLVLFFLILLSIHPF
ncbi:unnamed protein product [Coregonus sp. 'balchen']|nr:unnamed protein product [Coregonus sp. 'balchen']